MAAGGWGGSAATRAPLAAAAGSPENRVSVIPAIVLAWVWPKGERESKVGNALAGSR
jgi:hypothetical protein